MLKPVQKQKCAMPSLEYNGANLHYETRGAGPVVVFVHAGIADSRMWDDQWDIFAQRYQVVRYDTRGYGQTIGSDVAYSNRADLRAIMDQLGIEKAALVGCSRGGQISADTTVETPKRVWALVTVGGGISGDIPGIDWDAMPKLEMDAFEEGERLMEVGDLNALAELEAHAWVEGFYRTPDQVSKPMRDKVKTMLLQSYTHRDEGGQPIVLDPPGSGRLDEIKCPVLITYGDVDETATRLIGDYLAANIPDAQKYIFANSAHVPNMEHAEEFNRVVLNFLDKALQD